MELSLDLKKRYTYADYLTWRDDKRRELVNGFIRMMKSAESPTHQMESGHLASELHHIIKKDKRPSEVFFRLDVRLPVNGETEDDKIDTVVQPDIIICDPSKLDERGCLGAPDFVAEVQSFFSAKYDTTLKFKLYEAAGVREYWVVYPSEGVEVFILQPDGKYDEGTRYETGRVPVHIFDGLTIDLNDVF